MDRKSFLSKSSALLYLAASGALFNRIEGASRFTFNPGYLSWDKIRALFDLRTDYINMSALLISSQPEPVRKAIEFYYQKLNQENAAYLVAVNREKQNEARKAAAAYLNVKPEDVALTESTTMGLGLIYQGLQLTKGDEIIIAGDDYYSTYQSVRLKAIESGAKMVEINLYRDTFNATVSSIVKEITAAISSSTRIIALTWVHSGTGLKLPLKEISAAIKSINSKRKSYKNILLCVDGVHGFGVEDFNMSEIGCDIFIAGCHKWLFGPRGTGLVWGNERAWQKIKPVVPSFIEEDAWKYWREKKDIPVTTASLISPGGFKSFENLWALPEAFTFHKQIGKASIEKRTHELANSLKSSLIKIPGITVHTPKDDRLSSGIICFDIKGLTPYEVVERLQRKKIIASVTPYLIRHARLSPCIYNSSEEVEDVIREIKSLT